MLFPRPLASGQPHREGMGALSLSCRASQILFMISGTRLSGSLPDYRSHQRLFGLLLASFTTAHLSMNAATGGTCLATAGGLRYPNPPSPLCADHPIPSIRNATMDKALSGIRILDMTHNQ